MMVFLTFPLAGTTCHSGPDADEESEESDSDHCLDVGRHDTLPLPFDDKEKHFDDPAAVSVPTSPVPAVPDPLGVFPLICVEIPLGAGGASVPVPPCGLSWVSVLVVIDDRCDDDDVHTLI